MSTSEELNRFKRMGASRLIASYAALACSAWSGPVQAAGEPLGMAPASQWEVDYAEASCALRRAFAAGDEKAILEIRQYAPGEDLEVLIKSETMPRVRSAPRLRFEPDEGWHQPADPIFVESDVARGVVFDDSFRPNALKPQTGPWPAWSEQDREGRERAITGLVVTGSFERDLTLQTGAMHQPMEAMRACLKELVTHWGVEEVARGPVPIKHASWARRALENFPTAMRSSGKTGRVPLRLIVGKEGRPTACFPNGFAESVLVEAACSSLMRYARFEPALDPTGQPAAGTYITTLLYEGGG